MPRLFQLARPFALLEKLEREAKRLLEAASEIDEADHFFNFCTSAHAMRDYIIHAVEEKADIAALRATWDEMPELIHCRDIANASKHNVLRRQVNKNVAPITTLVFEVKTDESGTRTIVQTQQHTRTSLIHFDDGGKAVTVSAGDIVRPVLEFWRDELARLQLDK